MLLNPAQIKLQIKILNVSVGHQGRVWRCSLASLWETMGWGRAHLLSPFLLQGSHFVGWQEAGRNICPQASQSLLLCTPPWQTGGRGQLSFWEGTLKWMFSSILVGSLSEQGYDIGKTCLPQNHHFQNFSVLCDMFQIFMWHTWKLSLNSWLLSLTKACFHLLNLRSLHEKCNPQNPLT